ncbi:SpaA isopeptide-forming pilin-related protein, partial [Gemmatimonadota bacterium]
PRDYYFLLGQGGQTANNGHSFQSTPEDVDGVVAGKYLKWSHDGTTLTTDTIFVGRNAITYLDADIMARVHHELDDSTDVPTFTGGDETAKYGAGNPVVSLWRNDTLQAGASPTSAAAGYVTFANQMTGEDYVVTFAATGPRDALTDTLATVPALDGGAQSVRVCPLGDDTVADCGTFAFKFNNHTISGTLAAADATPAAGIHVNIMPTADFIQPNVTDTTVTTTAGGVYTLTGLREGPYTITPADSVEADGTVWTFVAQPDTVVDAEGVSATTTWNTTPAFMAAEILGVVVNDRDLDTNTIDMGEALVGVELNLYRGDAVVVDSLETTTTTDADGAYTFDWLPEGTYTVERVATTEANVLRALVSGSSFTVTTAAAVAPTWGGNNTRRIGHLSPRPLPAWDYDNSVLLNGRLSNFTFLYGDGEVGGTAHLNGDTSTKIENLTMYLRRCNVSAGSTSPPTATGGCTTYISGIPAASAVTAADGTFSFTDLEEGVYEVVSSPITAGYNNDNTGAVLFIINGMGDVEVFNSFKVSM